MKEAEVCMTQQEGRSGSAVVEGVWCCGAVAWVLHPVRGPQFKRDMEKQVKVQWRTTCEVW